MTEIDLGIDGITDVEEVGRTAAYTTYRVRDARSGQLVLIKVVHGAERPPSVIERFLQEQSVLVELANHPNLVSVLGHSTTTAGEPFIVTQLVPDTTARERFGATPPMTGPEVLRLGIRAAGALESVHRGGVVHGDLRPENIVLPDSGDPSIADVGLVTLTGVSATQTNEPAELEHASPEALDGQNPTPAFDQYSLATTLYHLLAGEPAFVRLGDTSVVPVIKRIATDPPPDLKAKGVPPAVADVVHRALSKNPGDRFPNLQAFARALQQSEVGLGLPVTDLTVMTPVTRLPTAWADIASTAPTPPTAPAAPPPTAGAPPSSGGPPGAGPAPVGGRSRTPLFIGIGVAVVLAVIAAFLLTRGGNDKKNAAATSSSSATATTRRPATSSLGTDSSTDFSPPGFITVDNAFERGTVEVFVPEDWTDSVPVQLGNGEPRLRVAPDVTKFRDGTFFHPGVQLDAFAVAGNPIDDPSNLDALLENFAHQPVSNDGWPGGPPADVCVSVGRGAYPGDLNITSDGDFSGRFERFNNCRGGGSLVVVFATPPDRSFILQMVVQIVTPADEVALPTIVGSVLVVNFP